LNARNVMVYYRKINEKVHDVTFRSGAFGRVKLVLFSVFRAVIIIGMSYIILGPVINIVSNSFSRARMYIIRRCS